MWPFHHAALRSFQLGGGNRRKCLAMLKAGMAKVPHNLTTKQKKKEVAVYRPKSLDWQVMGQHETFFFFSCGAEYAFGPFDFIHSKGFL